MRWVVPAIVFGAAMLAGKKAKGEHMPDEHPSERRQRLRCAIAAAGMGDDWLRFLETTAKRESNFHRQAHNDDPSEVARSKKAAQKNANRLAKLGWSPEDWSFGSKGLFQFLGPYVVLGGTWVRFPDEMVSPDMAYDPGVAVAAAFDFARGLTKWGNFDGTWAALRVGWGLPGKMHDPERQKKLAAKMEQRAASLGWPQGWAFDQITPLPDTDKDQRAALAYAANDAYWGCL